MVPQKHMTSKTTSPGLSTSRLHQRTLLRHEPTIFGRSGWPGRQPGLVSSRGITKGNGEKHGKKTWEIPEKIVNILYINRVLNEKIGDFDGKIMGKHMGHFQEKPL